MRAIGPIHGRPSVPVVEKNDQRPAHLHAGTVRPRRDRTMSRAEWRRHLDNEPPGLLRNLHLVPRRRQVHATLPTVA